MKKGDVVTIKDGSYTKSVIDGELVHEYLAIQSKQYKVAETGCSFPAEDTQARSIPSFNISSTFNNTVIQAIDSGKVIFIEERFLELVLPKHVIMVDLTFHSGYGVNGQTYEISDELYKQIKK